VPPFKPPVEIQDALLQKPATGLETEPSRTVPPISEIASTLPPSPASAAAEPLPPPPRFSSDAYVPPLLRSDSASARGPAAASPTDSPKSDAAAQAFPTGASGLARKLWRKLTQSSKTRRASQVSSSRVDRTDSALSSLGERPVDRPGPPGTVPEPRPAQPRMETIYSAGVSAALTRAGSNVALHAVNSASLPLAHPAAADSRAPSRSLRMPVAFAVGGKPSNRDGGGYVPVNSAYTAGPPCAIDGGPPSDSDDSAAITRNLLRHASVRGHSAASGGIVPPPSIAPETPLDLRDLEFLILQIPAIQLMLPMIPVRASENESSMCFG
jgi:hypothetical protein